MAKRDRYSRWRRLPPVFRSGEHKLPGPGDELQRIILYLKGEILDQAEAQADKAGVPTLQEYCAELLARAIEIERLKNHVAEIEARRGPLEGLSEISGDLEYLAEWQRRFDSGKIRVIKPQPTTETGRDGNQVFTVPLEAQEPVTLPEVPDSLLEEADAPAPAPEMEPETSEAGEAPSPRKVRIEIARDRTRPIVREPERIVPEVLDRTAVETVFVHVGPGDRDPDAFLPCLRRGQGVDRVKVDELCSALGRIEAEQRGATMLDRHLSYALYRLALESQVLITEVWPGVFDDRNISAVRAVQEMVERILSGEEIRYEQVEQSERWEENR
ncbi:MAG: hypothetical protein ACP5XB_25270 [Isosphaeraceae bacterium]